MKKKTIKQIEQEARDNAVSIVSKCEEIKRHYSTADAATVIEGIIEYLKEQKDDLF